MSIELFLVQLLDIYINNMSKIKPSCKAYTFQANVFNERFGSEFGVTTNITILANNEKDAYDEAKKSFNKYVYSLNLHHNIDANGKLRKTINTFKYNNLKMV